jgi:hypothetical protein
MTAGTPNQLPESSLEHLDVVWVAPSKDLAILRNGDGGILGQGRPG